MQRCSLKNTQNLSGLIFSIILIFALVHMLTQSTWLFYNIRKNSYWDAKWGGYSLSFFIKLMISARARPVNTDGYPFQNSGRKKVFTSLGLMLYRIGFCFKRVRRAGVRLCLHSWCAHALGGIAGPAFTRINIKMQITRQMNKNAIGCGNGLSSLMSACAIFGPVMMTAVCFSYFYRKRLLPFIFPGAPFLVGAFLANAPAQF